MGCDRPGARSWELNSNGNPNCSLYRNSNTQPHARGVYGYSHRYSYFYAHTDRYAHADGYSHAVRASHADTVADMDALIDPVDHAIIDTQHDTDAVVHCGYICFDHTIRHTLPLT